MNKPNIIKNYNYIERTISTFEQIEIELLYLKKDFEIIRYRLKKDSYGVFKPLLNHDKSKIIIILSGKITIDPYQKAKTLTSGDTLELKDSSDCYYYKIEEDTIMLCIYDCHVFDQIKHLNNKATKLMIELLKKDHKTSEHCFRVQELSMKIASKLEIHDHLLYDLYYASYFHDIGKIKIPDEILLKPGPLTTQEKTVMETHPLKSSQMLKDIFNESILEMILQHHERYDGNGYPLGLKADQINYGAKIIAVADSYDAIVANRPYCKGHSSNEAIKILANAKERLFEPKIIDALIEVIKNK
ncbi:HD domain-containing phosphohydrolase [Thomasclavelia sp.]|uniref:HD-GYP domain-containing protein n=1 Tax=Thomasclavelia sp. TaxID=3025757 RepID=UPI0025CEE820|nr:HD domain-containing phosphohydrolase [Thomasclavelia sp.]